MELRETWSEEEFMLTLLPPELVDELYVEELLPAILDEDVLDGSETESQDV